MASPDNRTRAAPGNDAAPFFTGSSTDRSVDENSPAMTAVGAPVSATDLGGDTLSGTSAGLFTVDGGTGQIPVKQGTLLDYEEGISYSVTLTASDPPMLSPGSSSSSPSTTSTKRRWRPTTRS